MAFFYLAKTNWQFCKCTHKTNCKRKTNNPRPQISNRGRLVLGQEKEGKLNDIQLHQFLQLVGPNSSPLNVLLCWIIKFLTIRVSLKITVYLGYYKITLLQNNVTTKHIRSWHLGWPQIFHDRWQMVCCCFLLNKSYLWLLLILKDFFWELNLLIYGNLTYLKNWKISSEKILKLTYRFLTGHWFSWALNFLGLEILALQIY